MVSLQEQLMKAGLVDKKKVNKAQQDKSKQHKEELRSGSKAVDQSREAAVEQQRKNAERARELNAQRDAAAGQKAVMAQVIQMVQQHRQPKGNGDVAYNFTIGSKIERIYVADKVQQHLVNGRLVIVVLDGVAELVPKVVGEKIAERAPEVVVAVKKAAGEQPAEDDPYADYKIPDDFTW
ncbi:MULTISPECIES: DUF2058 domain-containing protein [unclassified Duganella]|uniref:DUF2058 domain-containing protein n=1 Tax=unclassified Duganella TaxID=2636909 RepID=UPI0006F84DFA|nr:MULTISPECIES: DUF2058 domain-containing protein [unclassified Duganella]KQV44848.1 nucleoprotein/polynucleotide-associated enzyme [Duganella sp. Root336D2]KRB83371.1 nucleoprotein/polynucleotide-associated enzyme [Duganella sp. Root198D2]